MSTSAADVTERSWDQMSEGRVAGCAGLKVGRMLEWSCAFIRMPVFEGPARMSSRREVMTVRADAHRTLHGSWFAQPTTSEGQWAAFLALLAFACGVLGEAARREELPGPFYAVAFASALLAGAAAVAAVRRGERSLLALFAFLPLVIGMGFGVAELLG